MKRDIASGIQQEIEPEMRRLITGVIRSQGNRFIKELLRSKGLKIGKNKSEFEQNLLSGLQSNKLTRDDINNWLTVVEAWGNHHVYIHDLSGMDPSAISKMNLEAFCQQRSLTDQLDAVDMFEFPDEPALTSIQFIDDGVRLTWHQANTDWKPEQTKDFRQEEGLDLYEYRAYRQVASRHVMRFEAFFRDQLAVGCLFVSVPANNPSHESFLSGAYDLLNDLFAINFRKTRADISVICRTVDQFLTTHSASGGESIIGKKARLASPVGYIEFASTSSEIGYLADSAIRDVRQSIRDGQLTNFDGQNGEFVFTKNDGLKRNYRVTLYGLDHRVRLWASMSRDEAWAIIQALCSFR